MKPVAIPIVKEPRGNIKVLQPAVMTRVKAAMKPGKIYLMEIKPKEKLDSDPMRRYFFGVVMAMIADETGHSVETIHNHFKRQLLGAKIDEHGIEELPSVFSKESEMPISAKQEYIAEIRRWAWDFLNLAIPDPENAVL